MDSTERNAVVVGGSRGIGKALALELAEEFTSVTVLSRNPPDWTNPRCTFIQCDAVSDALPEIDGPIHALAYCPGSINLKPFGNLKDEDFVADWTVNVLGAVRVLRKYEAQLKSADRSSVILFSTVATQAGMPYHASIASAKAGVEGLGKALAAEWAPGVRVNVIAPSLTETDLAARLLRTEKQREDAANRHPLGRFGQPSDAAALAAFLLTDRSGWITGQVMQLDGGMAALRTM